MGAARRAFERRHHVEIEDDADRRRVHARHQLDSERVGLAFLLARLVEAHIGRMAMEEMAQLVRHDEDHGVAVELLEQALDLGTVEGVVGHAERRQRQGAHAVGRRTAERQHGGVVEHLLLRQPVAVQPRHRHREVAHHLDRRERQDDPATLRGVEVHRMAGVLALAEIEHGAAQHPPLLIGQLRQHYLIEVRSQAGRGPLRDAVEARRRIETAPVVGRWALRPRRQSDDEEQQGKHAFA